MDVKYPNRATICLTVKAFEQVKQEIHIRHILGDLSPNSIIDKIILNITNDIEGGNNSFPIYLDSV